MGLLKAGAGALGGVLADQWKEFFYCDSLDSDTLVAKGEKRVGKRSSNTKGTDNVISNGSVISVNEGQSMIIVESGKVVEFSAEPGEFVYDSSTEPSIFCGSLGESIKKSFAEVGKRFTFGGDAAKDQRVYYFNTKEITGNKFGTPAPVPFRVTLDESMNYKLSVDLRCNGVYSYKIADPLLFYTNVSGNVEYTYDRSELDEMLKSELLDALRPAFAKVSAMKIMYSEIPAHTKEVTSALAGELSSEWREKRGIELYAVSINGVSIPDDQRKKITEWEENLMTMNPNMAASRIVGSQADAMRTAAGNPNGAAAGFFGMGMAGNAGGANAANLFAMGANTENSAPKTGWTCSCGAVNTGKFCSECGKPNPGAAPKYKCNKCGWVPENPENPPKFCPECGDAFDGNDRV